jgi:hypothetical protein
MVAEKLELLLKNCKSYRRSKLILFVVYLEITPLKFLCGNTYNIMTTKFKKLSQTQFTIKLKLNNDKLQSNNTDIDPSNVSKGSAASFASTPKIMHGF